MEKCGRQKVPGKLSQDSSLRLNITSLSSYCTCSIERLRAETSLDFSVTLHHSTKQNIGTLPNSATYLESLLKTATLTTLFHALSFHLAYPMQQLK